MSAHNVNTATAAPPGQHESKVVERPAIIGLPSSKVRDHHWNRLAIVYVRQSSPQQVAENRESRERQYALADFAQRLGWPQDRVLLIDEDQGLSGRSAEKRSGFQRLMAEVTMNHVGLVLALELSRLSRWNKDWHHLMEVCAVFNALLGDQDGIYDANDSNDRLLLGMKGAMGEYELITLRNRLERGRENKAQRGELFLHLPIGYVKSPTGEVVKEPDEQARAVVELIFDKFQELGTAWAVLRYFLLNKIQIGYRCLRGPNLGRLEWRRPLFHRILNVLHHPIYAGAYAYGFHGAPRRNAATGQCRSRTIWVPPDEIRVLIRGRVSAYISWDQYLANQEQLRQNRSRFNSKGAPRRGEALLAGIAVCGACGERISTHHRARDKPRYHCASHLWNTGRQKCYGLSSKVLDDLVARQVLRALKPAALELNLHAIEDVERERERLHCQWCQRLERTRYEADRMERQYQAAEPENRLVAKTLETRWEEALRKERQIREEYDRFLRETPAQLGDAERATIRALAQNIDAIWQAPTTSAADRKDIIRCLVDRVVVHVKQKSEYVDVTIHWHGGFTSRHEIVRPVFSYRQLRDHDRLMERVKELQERGQSVPAIAAKLNEEGFVPPRRKGSYSVGNVAPLIQQLGLVAERNREGILRADEWWVRDLARELEIGTQKLYYWVWQGWVHSRRTPSRGHWVVWADQDELTRLRKLKAYRSSWTAARARGLTVPKAR